MNNQEIIKDNWFGCYGKGWGKDITPESYSHPAKMSRGLVYKIFQHLLDEGYVKPGDCILDPFAGIGGTCLDALANGLNWTGIELEQKFVDMGAGCECTGMSKADWVRFYGRWERANWKDGRYWCPRCLAEARQVKPPDSSQLALFGTATPSTSYVRNSGRIPHAEPHHYTGNLELFGRYARGEARAVLVQGDSRNLREVLKAVGGLVSSPPYAGSETTAGNVGNATKQKWGSGKSLSPSSENGYGQTPGQLAGLPEGQFEAGLRVEGLGFDALISSSPYANSMESGDKKAHIDFTKSFDGKDHRGKGNGSQGTRTESYGQTEGQLGAMPEGNLDELVDPKPETLPPAALVSSPMFAGNSGGRGEASREGIDPALFDRHSGGMIGGIEGSEGNIGGLPMRGFEAVVSSPVYVDGCAHTGGDDPNPQHIQGGKVGVYGVVDGYGKSNGQLSAMPEGPPPDPQPLAPAPFPLTALVSSAPFAGSVGSDDPAKRGGLLISDPRRAGDRNLTGTYGVTDGQLGAMAEGEFGGLVGSPPFEDSLDRGTVDRVARVEYARQNGVSNAEHISPIDMERVGKRTQEYGSTDGQLGREAGETFWSAAKTIITESYLALAPNAVAAWVCKDFVKDGQRKPFCAQWRMLCEAVGFEYLYTIRAWQVTERGTQGTMAEGHDTGAQVVNLAGKGKAKKGKALADKSMRKSTKSFFRLLAEKNGSPPIDFEEVIFFRKPAEVR